MDEQRVIRVFISSTFRDMKEEREILVKRVFPQLRKICEERQVTWGEVDLRWGVTEEQKAEGKVLPICLEEIKRCRPYFIGLLGERYGWIPDAIPQDLIQRETWLKENLSHSVTELEILHGVLNNPDMAEHAFFYFRDPQYLKNLPEDADLSYFISEDEASRTKLENLKERIRKSVFPVIENYPYPKALEELVLKDFTKVIDALYHPDEKIDPLDRDALDHEAFAQSRAQVYIGRDEYFERLDEHVHSNKPPLLVLGESGSGKSALLANWALTYKKEHPDHFLILHFIGASTYSADWSAMLRRVMGELKRHFNIQQDIPDKPDELRSAFANWLHMAAAKGKVILILDALNQLEDQDGAPDMVWLPPVIPENIRLILSTLPGRPLDDLKKRNWPTLIVKPLTREERALFIEKYLFQYTKALSDPRAEKIAKAQPSENPLYLKVLLEELRLFGEHEKLDERMDHYLEATNSYELYSKVLARWEEDYEEDNDLVGNSMSLIWAARRGLTESEILSILGKDGEPLPRAEWSPLFLAASESLISRSGLLNFSHDFLRDAVRDTYIPTEEHQKTAHIRLADYFDKQRAHDRMIDELPWQFRQADNPHGRRRLYDLFADLSFLSASWQKDQFDVKTYWSYLEGHSLRKTEAYKSVLTSPEDISDKNHVWLIATLLADTGNPHEAFSLRNFLVDHYRDTKDIMNLQASLGNLALILHDWGRLDESLALLKEQERICRELGNKQGLQKSLGSQAVILRDRGDLDAAIALLDQTQMICRETDDKEGLSISLINQAQIIRDRGELDEAMVLLKEAERMSHEQGNKDQLQKTLGNQAMIHIHRGSLDAAIVQLEEQERLCRELGNKYWLSVSLGNQASTLHNKGDLIGAMTLLKQSEQLCRELDNKEGLQFTLGKQGQIQRDRGDLESAMQLLKEAELLCRNLPHKEGLCCSLHDQACILNKQGDLVGAITLLDEAERIARELRSKIRLQGTLNDKADIFHQKGELDLALALLKESEQLCRELGNKELLQVCLWNQAVILSQRGDLDGAMLLYKEQELICRELRSIDGLQRSIGKQANILYAWGKLDEAMELHKKEEQICRELGDKGSLQRSIGNQALILYDRGQLDEAMALYKEQELICKELGDKDGLSISLGSQAVILYDREQLNEAMALLKEQERICRELGNKAGLTISLINQADLLAQKMDKPKEALPLAEEAYNLTIDYGLSALSNRIKPMLDEVKKMALSSKRK